MESPLRYIASDEYSSSWLKFHLGLPRQPSQRTKHPNQQQQQRKQPQHLNTLGLRLNAAGNIKPTVVHMPSLEHRWKIHYSYKTKVLSRPVIENPVPVDPPASQRNTREWQRSGTRNGSPHNGGKERTRARSAASTTLARGREQRSPRIRVGTPELVTTTPIRLLGVLRSPENALNWRANDGQQRSPPRYFTFPPVTGSRAGASSLVRPERRGQVSTAPVESRLRGGPEKEDLLTFSRSSSSESLPSSWKYSDGTTTLSSNNDVQDDPTQHETVDTSTEAPALPTIDEEDAAASEAKHSIRVHISRNNSSSSNRYNNCNDYKDNDSDVLHRREGEYVDEDSDSLSVYDDDGEDDNEEKWAGDTKKPAPRLAVPQTQLVDNEGINRDHNYDHNGDQNGDQNEDHNGDHNENHNGDQNEDHNEDQNEENENYNGAQNEDYKGDQTEDYIGDHDDHNEYQHKDYSLNKNDDHNRNQNECHNGDQDEDHNIDQNAGPSGDINEDQTWDQSGYLGRSENTYPRECNVDDYQENEAWTKEVTDYSPTQRTVYPPLTLRGRDSGESLPLARDVPTADQSREMTEGTHLTDVEHNRMKVLVELIETQGTGEVEDLKGANDIDYPEELCERKGQEVSETRVDGDLSRGAQPKEGESEEQNVECNILKETSDENNNVFGTQDHNEEATARNIEIRETSDCSEADVEDSTKSVARDSHGRHGGNVDIDLHQTEEHESNESKIDEPMMVVSTELSHATDSQSDMDSKVHIVVRNVDDCGQRNSAASPTEKLDGSSDESVSLESTISASQEERSCPPAGKAARKRSVRFSQDVATVYLFLADESDTSDSGFLSP